MALKSTSNTTSAKRAIPLNIALYRRRRGLSQSALARELDIHPGTLSRIENGHQYLTEVMEQRIAYALDLSTDERNHMVGLPLGTGGAADRASQPGRNNRRLWLVGAPAGSDDEART